MINILACPFCQGNLVFDGVEAEGRLRKGLLECISCSQTFQVRDEIPDLRAGDWSKNLLTEKKILELLDLNEDALRSLVEERGTYPESQPAEVQEADVQILETMCSKIAGFPFVLDIASGRGILLRNVAKGIPDIHLVGTDIDENMLRTAQEELQNANLYEQTSLLLCDVGQLPFKSDSIPSIVSLAGFSNIQNAAEALSEVNRVLSPRGILIFSSLFLQEGSRSFEYTKRLGLADVATEDLLKKSFENAGLKLLSLKEVYSGIHPGYSLDLLPFRGDWFSENLIIATSI